MVRALSSSEYSTMFGEFSDFASALNENIFLKNVPSPHTLVEKTPGKSFPK